MLLILILYLSVLIINAELLTDWNIVRNFNSFYAQLNGIFLILLIF